MTRDAWGRLLPEAPPGLRRILDPGRGELAAPIRAEIFGPDRFAQHGRSLGLTHRAERTALTAASFFPRLRSNVRVLREAHREIGQQAATGYDVSPAAEWLLDNFHLIEAQLDEVRAGLPRSYFRALPVLQDEPLAGLPRVYGIAWAFVAHTDGAFDDELLGHFLVAYQETRELNLCEMWALPTTLRVVLIESLRRLAERVAAHKAARELANLCCDRAAGLTLERLDELQASLGRRGVGRVFLAQLAQRLHDRRSTGEPVEPPGLEAWLHAALPDAAEAHAEQAASQAADNLSVGNAVTSLRTIGDADWPAIVGRSSVLMRRMLGVPLFEAEHVTTRDRTLHSIERLARRSGRSELEVADELLERMRAAADDTGPALADHWLRGAGRPTLAGALGLDDRLRAALQRLAARAALPVYLAAVLGGTLLLVAALLGRPAAVADGWALLGALLMLLPASETAIAVINRLISESARPSHLPRLALAAGIPAAQRVLVVVPALLGDAAGVERLVHRLRLHALANAEPAAQFALLSDWNDADAARVDGDEALLELARRRITELNDAHPNPAGEAPRFLLLHREREFSQTEQRWIGWERKRGKLQRLVAALATGEPGGFIDLGELSRLAPATRYLVTLDSDTELPPGRLRELVAIAAHPQNRPRLDAGGRRVVAGYGILQPHLATPLPAAHEATRFHRLFAGQSGIDPYSAASSEVFQDLFGEGSFSGKGLLDVQAVHAVLHERLADGCVPSHDLLEGAFARCAAVTDVTLFEDAPFHADVAASRVHRWTRGDWQLLPILAAPRRYSLGAVARWKMLDNLRRSLVAPASLALLVLALAGATVAPGTALLLVFAAFTAGPLLGAVAGCVPDRRDVAPGHFLAQAGADLARALGGGLWHLAQLLAQARLATDAIVRALWRLAVSRRHLLQWTTAAAAQAGATTQLPTLLRRHRVEPLLALALLAALLAAGTPHPLLATLLCLLWAAAPLSTWWVSRPPRADAALAPAAAAQLHEVARDTWRLFERIVGPDDRHLPPDNLQVLPHEMVAHRTSPTNIGLYLLATACARSFGWIGTQELLARLEATLASVATLTRHRGHLLNWYDTQTGAPLLPAYVSTVDSGNLSGHLLAVAAACRERAALPHDGSAARAALARSRQRLQPLLARRQARKPAERDALRLALADHRATRRSAQRDANAALRGDRNDDARRRLLAVARNCEHLAWLPEYGFLYHRRRRLFHIGLRVAEQQLDTGFYDLLASEARLTSLLAIAKGDVPVAHWAALGRPFHAAGLTAGLRSWSGSMFEYLMPTLVLAEPRGSVLHDAARAAVREQIAFGDAHALPWGVSESAHAGRDHTLAYQYAPQGVPRLALRRTPADELVVAPYATALAAPLRPQAALRNLVALTALGARARYGFIEALDYSAPRLAGAEPFTPVATFMAHHQGMTIVALANLLLDGVAQRWGMADPHIEAVASLLHERAPRGLRALPPPAAGPPPAAQRGAQRLLREVLPGANAVEPTQVLSNGRYSVTLRANGAGTSRWGTLGLSRSRDDALRDACGHFIYLRWDRQPVPVSITQHPAPDPAAQYRSVWHADRVCFDAAWPALQAHTTVWVSPEDDIEFRKVELRNLTERELDIELISAFEPTLADPRADEAHPAFSNLFLRAEWQPAQQALWFERKPRLAHERGLHAAHFLAGAGVQASGVAVQTDRQRWLGRNRPPGRPLADLDAVPSGPGAVLPRVTGLDPVCVLAVRLRIAPGGKAEVTFATAASDDAGTLGAVVDKHRQASHVQRTLLMSATLAGIRLRALGIGAETFAALQALTTALVQTLTRPPSEGARADADAACDRRTLWPLGISGDRPIVLVSAGALQGRALLRSLAQALRLWAWGGIACDLVVVNAEPVSYQMDLQHELSALRGRHAAEGGAELTGWHLLRAADLPPGALGTLRRLARVRLHADGRPLLHQLREWSALHDQDSVHRQETSTTALAAVAEGVAGAPQGRFDTAGGDFSFDVAATLRPPRPWINVLSNPGFGAQISEAGGGFSWAVNSRLNQLTGWSNDPVADPPSEWFLLQDLDTHEVWSVTPGPWGDARVAYRVVHGQGGSVVAHRRGDVDVEAAWCVDAGQAVKQVRLRITRRGRRAARLRVVGIAEWTMGAGRADRATVHTALGRQRLPEAHLTALFATQRERSAGFGDGTAFLALARPPGEAEDWTCDRRECFDARGYPVLPDHFGQRSGDGLDPCSALATQVKLDAGETVEVVFLLGWAPTPAAARALATVAAVVPAARRAAEVKAMWDGLLGATTVRTPDPLFDVLVNRWLLYQAVSCRLWAKAGFYQAGGATGFRDQLQDTMALAWAAPAMLRAQIVLCATRQFAAGDVQHWWHAPLGAGVRTRFSDDLLWLPHAVARWLRTGGDPALLDETVPFLAGEPVPEGAEDRYDTPVVSAEAASVYEHAARTIDHSLRVGVHGLPLIGTGDWNDGMNRVGHEGRGESVWLAWFLCRVVAEFAPIACARGQAERALRWEQAASGWQAALQGPAWDGAWYRRAFFDDGSPLGSAANAEARIDLIAQAWAVLSGAAPAGRQRLAMAAVEAQLVDADAGLVRLLDPPLVDARPNAGYIQAYPPGVRENGGQYAHAAVWALMAQAQLAQGPGDTAAAAALAWRGFTWISPAHRAADPLHGAAYGIEPYVVAGDICSQGPYIGRGGWSWYTGAAAWLHRAAVESIFGLQLDGDGLHCLPCLPAAWGQAELTLRRDGRALRLVFAREPAALHPELPRLAPGQRLRWHELPQHSEFVVPLSVMTG